MSTPRIEPFDKLYAGELDEGASVANLTERNDIDPAKRYLWMEVRDNSTGIKYRLEGGLLNSNWVDISETGGGQVPTKILSGKRYTVKTNSQALMFVPIELEGDLIIDGDLVEL